MFSVIQSAENRGKKCHRFWLRLRQAMILTSNVRMSVSKKINLMALIRTPTTSTTTFERMKEKFDGFRQTELGNLKIEAIVHMTMKIDTKVCLKILSTKFYSISLKALVYRILKQAINKFQQQNKCIISLCSV